MMSTINLVNIHHHAQSEENIFLRIILNLGILKFGILSNVLGMNISWEQVLRYKQVLICATYKHICGRGTVFHTWYFAQSSGKIKE